MLFYYNDDLFVFEVEVFAVKMMSRGDSIPRHQQFPDVLVYKRVGVVVLRVHVNRSWSRCVAGNEPPRSADVLLPSAVPDLGDGIRVRASTVRLRLSAGDEATLTAGTRTPSTSVLVVSGQCVFFVAVFFHWRLFCCRRQLLDLRCPTAQHADYF